MAQSPTHLRVSTLRGQRQSFWRAGYQFTRTPRDIPLTDLDNSRVEALHGDPRLWVEPVVLDEPARRPDDQAAAMTQIVDAIKGLKTDDAANWTAEGAPRVPMLTALLGWPITAAERDTAWSQVRGNG
jgi:hypothetical protein